MIQIYENQAIGNNTPPGIPRVSDMAESKILRMGPRRALNSGFVKVVARAGDVVFVALKDADLSSDKFEAAQADLEENKISRFQWIQVWAKYYPDIEEANG